MSTSQEKTTKSTTVYVKKPQTVLEVLHNLLIFYVSSKMSTSKNIFTAITTDNGQCVDEKRQNWLRNVLINILHYLECLNNLEKSLDIGKITSFANIVIMDKEISISDEQIILGLGTYLKTFRHELKDKPFIDDTQMINYLDKKYLLTNVSTWEQIITNNKYVKDCVSNKKKDKDSLSFLVDRQLSQSDCIKLGNGIEKILKDAILSGNRELVNIKPKNQKGIKEKDHLFENPKSKTIYYAEIKTNLNLDTEKSKTTIEKCLQILDEMKIEYPNHQIKMFLVGARYYDKSIISGSINNKYASIKENLFGINDYLLEMECSKQTFETENDYKDMLNLLANNMFD